MAELKVDDVLATITWDDVTSYQKQKKTVKIKFALVTLGLIFVAASLRYLLVESKAQDIRTPVQQMPQVLTAQNNNIKIQITKNNIPKKNQVGNQFCEQMKRIYSYTSINVSEVLKQQCQL